MLHITDIFGSLCGAADNSYGSESLTLRQMRTCEPASEKNPTDIINETKIISTEGDSSDWGH